MSYISDPICLRCKDNERYQNRMKFLYQVGSEIGFPSTYPLDIDLSAGLRYAAFEQLAAAVAGPIYVECTRFIL